VSDRRGKASLAVDRAVAFLAWNAVHPLDGPLFFDSVNMVLVRLWTRAMQASLSGVADVPPSQCMSDRESGLAKGAHPSVGRREFRGAV
jgi:hypothetical protein